jgi:hypothetical protein
VAIVVVHWEQWEMLSNPLDAMKTTAVNWTRCQVIKDPKRTAPHLSLVASPLVNWIDFRRVFESPEETQTRAQTGTMLVQRGSGGVTEYRGSLADLKGRAETAVTAIECDCDELLVLQQQIPIGGAASVSLLSGPARAFQIVRRKEVRPEFQFLFPTAVIDDGLVQGPAGGVFVQPERLQRVRERLNALGPSADMQAFDDEDGVLAVLKQVIHAMRQEGDIGADELVLRNLCVWYQDRVTKETLFEVKYLGRVVRM